LGEEIPYCTAVLRTIAIDISRIFLRVQMVLGGVVYTAVPFYNRARKAEGAITQIQYLVALEFRPNTTANLQML
jgi:hypothetical protein